jgi:hypothetical protein
MGGMFAALLNLVHFFLFNESYLPEVILKLPNYLLRVLRCIARLNAGPAFSSRRGLVWYAPPALPSGGGKSNCFVVFLSLVVD